LIPPTQVLKEDGKTVFSKCLVPVVDIMNHAGPPLGRVQGFRARDLGTEGAAEKARCSAVRTDLAWV
jgi:hypothetical protein